MTPFRQNCSPPDATQTFQKISGEKEKQRGKKHTCWEDKEREIMYGHSSSHLQIAFIWKHEQTYSVPAVSATTMSPPILSTLMPFSGISSPSSPPIIFPVTKGFQKPPCSWTRVSYIYFPPACEWNANFWWVFTVMPYLSMGKEEPRLPLL